MLNIFDPVLECVFDLDFSCKCFEITVQKSDFRCRIKKGLLMRVHYLKLRNIRRPYFLRLNVLTASKGSNFYI